jgi:hypothetical protein
MHNSRIHWLTDCLVRVSGEQRQRDPMQLRALASKLQIVKDKVLADQSNAWFDTSSPQGPASRAATVSISPVFTLTYTSYRTPPFLVLHCHTGIYHSVCLEPARLVRPLSEVTQLGGQLRASSVHIPNLALHRRLNGHRSQEQSPSVCHYGVQYRVAGCKLLLPSLRAFHASCRSLLLTETPFTWAIGTRCHGALCIQESER